MKKVYIIDFWEKYGHFEGYDRFDQIECYSQKDVITHLKCLKKPDYCVNNVKVVEQENRVNESNVSAVFVDKIVKCLGYVPEFIYCND